MEENTFWLRIWQTGAAALLGIVLTVAGCTANQNRTVERMVKAGADPVKAACAVGGIASNNAVQCTLATMGAKGQP